MLNKQLQIGDHIISSEGELYLIEKVNKTTYTIVPNTNNGYRKTIPFNGKSTNGYYGGRVDEYFPCDNATEMIIVSLREENDRLKTELQKQKSDIEKARLFKENLEWLAITSLSELEERVEKLDENREED